MGGAVKEQTGIFPGTFDPVTLGHIDVLTRALHLFDKVIVAVASADRHHKEPLFSVEERMEMVRDAVPRNLRGRVEVARLEGLLVEFARNRGVHVVVRGLRFFSDFEYEFQMATMNQKLWRSLDTVFLMPTEKYSTINSTLVKEIARNEGSLKGLATPAVAARLAARLKQDLRAASTTGKKGRRGR